MTDERTDERQPDDDNAEIGNGQIVPDPTSEAAKELADVPPELQPDAVDLPDDVQDGYAGDTEE